MPDPFAQYAVGAKDDPFSAYAVKTAETPSTPQPLIGHPLSTSDEPPTFKDRLVNGFVDNPMIQGAAHPQSLGDVMSLLLPDMGAAAKVAAKAARPIVAPLGRGAIRTVAAAGDVVDPDLIGVISPRGAKVIKIAQRARAAMDTPAGMASVPRSLDSTARVLEPVAEAENVARPADMNAAHLDLSNPARPSEMTAQQIAERQAFGHGTPAETGRIRTPSLREKFPQGLPREMPTTGAIEPMPSHGPSVGASMLENAEARAKQILPDVPPASGRVPTGHGSQPDNLLETLPDEPVTSAMQQPRVDVGAERVGRANGMSKEQVRAQTAPILGEAQGAASPILPEKALQSIIDKMRTLPKGGPEREAYVAAATSGKAQWQIENIRRTLEHLGLLVPAAAAVSPDVRGMLLDRMRSGVTGQSSQ